MHVVNIYSKRVVPTALRRMRNARKREAVDNGRKKRANKAGDGLLEGFAIQLPSGMSLKTPDTERHAPPISRAIVFCYNVKWYYLFII